MCDTFVALADATADGSVILGKNSDREPDEAHEVVLVSARDHGRDESIRTTYLQIPQAQRTHASLFAKPYWIWGAEMGVNEHGVAIGNEAVFTKAKQESEAGLLGMDLLRLGLERGADAAEAVDVIVNHLGKYGQSGQAGHDHKLRYDNSYLVADPTQAFVLETIGRDWVTERVRSVRSISNALTIRDDWSQASPGLSKPGVDIAKGNSDFLYTKFSDSTARQCRTTETLTAAKGSLRLEDSMAMLRDHGSKDMRPDWTPASGLRGQTICAHAGPGPIRVSQTTGSMVVQMVPGSVTAWITATSAPCTSAFKPVWIDSGLPELGPGPGRHYDPKSLWWSHEDLHRETLLDYADRAGTYRGEIERLESEFRSRAAGLDLGEVQERARFTSDCFDQVAVAERRWLSTIRSRPVRHPAPRLYRRAWRRFDETAGR